MCMCTCSLGAGVLERRKRVSSQFRTRTRNNTNPNGTEANAAGRSARACDARKAKYIIDQDITRNAIFAICKNFNQVRAKRRYNQMKMEPHDTL